MSVSASRSRLGALTRDLLCQWQQTQEHWRDDKSRQFDRDYMDELNRGVNRAVRELESLEKILTKIRIDCE